MGIDLRREISYWLTEHGHWAVLRSAVLNRRCGCVDPESGQAKDKCSRCMATGFQYVDHIVKACKSFGLPDFDVDTPVGQAPVGSITYYLEYVTPAKRDDLIIEVELSSDDGRPLRPFKIREGYRITQVEDMRDASGRAEFWQLRCEKLGLRP